MARPALTRFRFGVPGISTVLASAFAVVACGTAPQSVTSDAADPVASAPDTATPAPDTAVLSLASPEQPALASPADPAATTPAAAPAAADDPATQITKDAEERWKIKVQQLQMEAEEHCLEGQKALERGDFEKARLYFEQTLNHIKWAPVGVQWGDLGARAQKGLDDATRAQSHKEVAKRREQEEEAFKKLSADENAERMRREAAIQSLMLDGIAAFNRRQFDDAEKLANQVLEVDPNNVRAKNLKDSAIEYARSQFNDDAFEARKDNFRRWKQDIEETRTPYAGILTNPDPEFWKSINEKRTSTDYLALGTGETAQDKELKQRIKNTMIAQIKFPEVSVKDAIEGISLQSGIPIVIAPAAASELETSGVQLNIPQLNDISVESLLEIITKQAGEGFTYIVDHGVVKVTKRDAISGNAIPRIHTVQDIAFKLNSFKSPQIGKILPPGAEISEEEGSPFGSEVAGESAMPTEDIVNLIKENIARGTWDTGSYSIGVANNDHILVVHTPEVHRQVAQFLDDLRKFSGTVVTIESRFVNIRDDFLNELGVDWKGLGGSSLGNAVPLGDVTNGAEDNAGSGNENNGPGPDLGSGLSPVAGAFFNDGSKGDVRAFVENVFTQEQGLGKALSNVGGLALQWSILKGGGDSYNVVIRAIEKSQFSTEVSSPILTVYNTQRANCNVVNQVSYIQDFDVDVANSAFIANPNVGILQEGVVLDVTPTISFDRKYITLEVRATVANILRPIRNFSTSLSGLSIPVTFQLPELVVQQANTTVRVPDGGSLLLGGLKRLRYINRTAEVPWLGKIPLIGAAFREKGLSDETGSLIILIKANITELSPWRDSKGQMPIGN